MCLQVQIYVLIQQWQRENTAFTFVKETSRLITESWLINLLYFLLFLHVHSGVTTWAIRWDCVHIQLDSRLSPRLTHEDAFQLCAAFLAFMKFFSFYLQALFLLIFLMLLHSLWLVRMLSNRVLLFLPLCHSSFSIIKFSFLMHSLWVHAVPSVSPPYTWG